MENYRTGEEIGLIIECTKRHPMYVVILAFFGGVLFTVFILRALTKKKLLLVLQLLGGSSQVEFKRGDLQHPLTAPSPIKQATEYKEREKEKSEDTQEKEKRRKESSNYEEHRPKSREEQKVKLIEEHPKPKYDEEPRLKQSEETKAKQPIEHKETKAILIEDSKSKHSGEESEDKLKKRRSRRLSQNIGGPIGNASGDESSPAKPEARRESLSERKREDLMRKSEMNLSELRRSSLLMDEPSSSKRDKRSKRNSLRIEETASLRSSMDNINDLLKSKKDLRESKETKSNSSPAGKMSLTPNKPLKQMDANGWVHLRTKLLNTKKVWHWRYCCLKGGWMCYYDNEQCRSDDLYGWVKVSGTTIIQNARKKEVRIVNKGKRLFHRHGPDPNIPPAARKHFYFHRKSHKCVMRFGDEKMYEKWSAALKMASELPATSCGGEEDSDNEDLYADLPIPELFPKPYPSELEDTPGTSDSLDDRSVSDDDEDDYDSPAADQVEDAVKDAPISTKTAVAEDELPVINPSEGHIVKKKVGFKKKKSKKEDGTPEETGVTSSGDDEAVNQNNREGLLKLLVNAVGLDVSTIALPVSLNEPTSFLQRMCEVLVSSELLDEADKMEDSCHRLAFVAAFAISLYPNNIRTSKPFNPLLGETFEYVNEKKFKFVAEQVSHHPPVGASHCETEHFIYWQEQGLKTKFGGNSLGCESVGMQHVYLKRSGEHYTWTGIKTVVHNVILGTLWMDHFGDTSIKNHKTGDVAKLDFTKCGWFSKGQYEVKAWILDSQGNTRIQLAGKWNDSLSATTISGTPLPTKNPIWVHTNQLDPKNQWKLSPFAQELNKIDDEMLSYLPKTDSRLRPDRRALEENNTKVAGAEKRRLEQEQRERAKLREQKGQSWKPKYFVRKLDEDSGEEYWKFTGTYWEHKEDRF